MPTSILEENCYTLNGTQVYGVMFGVTGFPPNTAFTGTLSTPTGQVGPATVTTNERGDWWYWLGAFVPATWTWTVESPYLGGTVTKEITVTCPKATTLEACKDGRYYYLGYRNQGECVAFARRGQGPG
jgi:hypothetical protein